MSKVIDKEIKTETITHEVNTIRALKCDCCKKEFTGDYIKYWKLTTHHYDWGNDSIDSFEYFDLCSEDCVKNELEKYFVRCKESDTQIFELHQNTFSPYTITEEN